MKKIIDEKGKLFGFINVVDLIVVVIIALLAIGIIVRFTSAKLNANGGNPLSEKKEVYVTLYSQQILPEVAENLHEGDKLVANNAYTDAEIVSITPTEAEFVGTNSEGLAIASKHPLWKDVTVVVKEKVNPNNVILKVGTQEVRVGYSFILKTQTVETNCRIRGISFEEPSATGQPNTSANNEESGEAVQEQTSQNS